MEFIPVLETLLNAFSGPGASFMYAITAVLALALAILLERAFLFLFRWRADVDGATDAFQNQDSKRAIELAGPVIGPVLARGSQEDSSERAWEAMGAAAIRAESTVRHRLSYLAASANIATMLGLLGTVYGLVVAFSALGDAGASATDQLSDGIATAMATTAFGLCVAIPCLAAHAWLAARADTLLANMEALAAEAHLAFQKSQEKPPSNLA
jgi:biopolymer transport protein ExbB